MKPPELSPNEWKIMKILWQESPLSAYDVITRLQETEVWHPNTIKTMLSRLQKKGAISAKKYKNLFLYSPLYSEEILIRAEGDSFLKRVFGGAVQPLLVHFAKSKKLSPKEIAELREILNRKESK